VHGEYCMAMTTTDEREAATQLARRLVEARLAACVQILDVRSVFTWQGSVDDAAECLLLIKTRCDLYERLESFIREHHSYDVPEILRVPIAGGFGPYLSWMDESTSSG
jgi:periplasmic divalent cation tolerance protein